MLPMPMGDALYAHIQSATGDPGRDRAHVHDSPEKQISNAFDQNQQQLLVDGYNESNQIPAGAWQSKEANWLQTKLAHVRSSYLRTMRTKIAGRALARRMKFRDFDVSIETDAGSYRHWYDPHEQKEGKTRMQYPYGYIRKTLGMDGEHVDCFVGPNEEAANVYVITTNKAPNFGQIDEQKAMLGFNSAQEAKRVFLEHYTDPRFFNSMSTLTYEDFKDKVFDTISAKVKKIASLADFGVDYRHTPGPFHDSTPGDYLGFPAASLVGLRKVEGDAMDPSNKVDRQFRFHDLQTNTRVLDGNDAATPASPGV